MIKNNQNIFDFTMENFGTLENLFDDVLVPNSLPVDQEIKADQEINIDTFEKGNQTVKKQIQTNGLVMTNGEIEAPVSIWILAEGIWNDSGIWIDTEVWID